MTGPLGFRPFTPPTGPSRRQKREEVMAGRNRTVAAGGIAEGSDAWDALPTDEKLRRYVGSGQDAVNQSTLAAAMAAMPELDQRIQGSREDAIRRGVNLGDIGTRDEGSLLSAFQRNIANTAGAGAMQNYQTGLERLYGYRDWRTGQDNAKAARRSGVWSGLGALAGTALGNPAIGGAVAKWFTGGKE